MIDNSYRPPTEWERSLLLKLADQPFLGRAEYLQQLEGLEVLQYDEHGALGCLRLRATSGPLLPIEKGPLVEASYVDGATNSSEWQLPPRVHVLLHVSEHRLNLMEIYKDDDSPIVNRPQFDELDLFTSHPG